jgi:hypothetical protein
VAIGDFARLDALLAPDRRYALVYVVFNTFFNVLTQDDQVRCFEAVAGRLAGGGAFVVEAFVPSSLPLHHDQYVRAEAVGPAEVRLDVLRHDGATQRIEENHVTLGPGGTSFNPVVQRYAWPAELDLMARIAGLHLRARWGGWRGEPFTSSSVLHVSVYGR